jgi:hypothetical protein
MRENIVAPKESKIGFDEHSEEQVSTRGRTPRKDFQISTFDAMNIAQKRTAPARGYCQGCSDQSLGFFGPLKGLPWRVLFMMKILPSERRQSVCAMPHMRKLRCTHQLAAKR